MDRQTPNEKLVRALGRWDLTALAANQIIGASIFVVGAPLALNVGGFSLPLIVGIGVVNLLIALCIAEVASRFDSTGGPYFYAREGLGVSLGFVVGWMQWFLRVVSIAAILHILLLSLSFWFPALETAPFKQLFFIVAIAGVALVLFSGIRQSSAVVNVFTISKLLPLFAFILIGIPHIDLAILETTLRVSPDLEQWTAAAFLIIFSLGGFEVASVPGGESKDARRHMAFALTVALVTATGILILVQLILLGVLSDLPNSETPVAEAMTQFLGEPGSLLIGVGVSISILGGVCGSFLAASRILFSMALHRDLPTVLSQVHAGTKTPWVAIVATSVVALWLALTGNFVALAAASGITRIIMYLGACAAALRFRIAPGHTDAGIRLPGGLFIHMLAIGAATILILSVSSQDMASAALILLVGVALTASTRFFSFWSRRRNEVETIR